MPERRLRRFFTGTPILAEGEKISLPASETRHLQTTLRFKVGDRCLVTDGSGVEAEAVIVAFSNDETHLRIDKLQPRWSGTSSIKITVYPAFLQKGKMDDLARQMQELGADGFFPIETERTMVKMESQARVKMAERWQKIVQEAAKQSGSLKAMKVGEPLLLNEALRKIPAGDLGVVFHPVENVVSFNDWTKSLKQTSSLHLFFGPEGGFSEKEISVFESKKFSKVKLGGSILKADTAILGVVSALKFLFV